MLKHNKAGQKQIAKNGRCRVACTLQSEAVTTRNGRCSSSAGKRMGRGRSNS